MTADQPDPIEPGEAWGPTEGGGSPFEADHDTRAQPVDLDVAQALTDAASPGPWLTPEEAGDLYLVQQVDHESYEVEWVESLRARLVAAEQRADTAEAVVRSITLGVRALCDPILAVDGWEYTDTPDLAQGILSVVVATLGAAVNDSSTEATQ